MTPDDMQEIERTIVQYSTEYIFTEYDTRKWNFAAADWRVEGDGV